MCNENSYLFTLDRCQWLNKELHIVVSSVFLSSRRAFSVPRGYIVIWSLFFAWDTFKQTSSLQPPAWVLWTTENFLKKPNSVKSQLAFKTLCFISQPKLCTASLSFYTVTSKIFWGDKRKPRVCLTQKDYLLLLPW